MTTHDNKKPTLLDKSTMTVCQREMTKALAKHERVKLLAKEVDRNPANTHRTLQELIDGGIARKMIRVRGYELTNHGIRILAELLRDEPLTTKSSGGPPNDKDNGKKVRGEKFAVMVKLRKKPDDWNKRRQTIALKRNVAPSPHEMTNWTAATHLLMDCVILTTPSSITITIPGAEYKTQWDALNHYLTTLDFIMPMIERKWNVEFEDVFYQVGQEYVDLDGMLTEQIPENMSIRTKYYVWHDPEGRARWKWDKSRGPLEWETMNKDWAVEDFRITSVFLYDLINMKQTLLMSEVAVRLEQVEITTLNLDKRVTNLEVERAMQQDRLRQVYRPESTFTPERPDYLG